MPVGTENEASSVDIRPMPDLDEQIDDSDDGPCIVILYNDEHHAMDAVVSQLVKATGYPVRRCEQIMFEAHTRGRAIAYTGSSDSCERAASILRQIRLQVETDRF